MQSVRQIQRLNDAELEKCVPPNASWHTDYRDTAYIHVGGLPFELSEGDVLAICSQYGNPVHINLVRDKETGKSRGFAFLKYEDQRSCDLAVDNLSGAGVLGRVLTVDHARYKPKEGEIEGEGMEENEEDADDTQDDATDAEDESARKRRRRSDGEEETRRPRLKEEVELAKLLQEHDNDDPMKAYLIQEKKEQVAEALKSLTMDGHDEQASGERSRHSRRKHDEREHERRHHGSRRKHAARDIERKGDREYDSGRKYVDDDETRARPRDSSTGKSYRDQGERHDRHRRRDSTEEEHRSQHRRPR